MRPLLVRRTVVPDIETSWKEVHAVFIVVHHTIKQAPTAFARGQNLLEGRGAPAGVRVRKFYPSTDQAAVFCLWEGNSVQLAEAWRDTSRDA
jgi:hypothetical protein